MTIQLIQEAIIQGCALQKACDISKISIRTFQRWKTTGVKDQRKNTSRCPANKLSIQERQDILDLCHQKEYSSSAPSQIVPDLADKGIYLASESTFYRVLREATQQHYRGRVKVPSKRRRPKAYRATHPNQVWTWDITYLPTIIKGRFFYLYMIIDVYSRKVVAWEIHTEESALNASKLITKACLSEKICEDTLVLHSDNGSPMKGATMLATLQYLGIMPSFSRPSVSNDNPYSEALFRTLKYAPTYPESPFSTLLEARQWVHSFVCWYNNEHHHSGLKFVTPQQRHNGEDQLILKKRKEVYLKAKSTFPERWSGRDIRNWDLENEVWLNLPKEKSRMVA